MKKQIAFAFLSLVILSSCVSKQLNCSSIKSGIFYQKLKQSGEIVKIERIGMSQKDTNLNSGVVWHNKIKWISDCEFQLIPLKSNNLSDSLFNASALKIYIYILEINKEYYTYRFEATNNQQKTSLVDTVYFKMNH